jgi:hypothetical protein
VNAPVDRAYVRSRLRTPFSRRRKLSLAFEILGAYTRVRRLLARARLMEVLQELRQPLADRATNADELDGQLTGVRLGRAVGRTLGALPADSRCLVRSLVLVDMLSRRGIEASFVLGVRAGPDFEGHAWVEKNGIALLPPYEGEYERLVEL